MADLCGVEMACVQLLVQGESDAQQAHDSETIALLDVFNKKLVISLDCSQ